MDERKKIVAAAGGVCAMWVYISRKKKRSKWVRKSWIAERPHSSHMTLLRNLKDSEPNDYRNYLRMSHWHFDQLLEMLGPSLQKQNTVMRQCIPPEERLAATLRFLATGRSYEDLKFTTRIAAQTLGSIIPETCKIIYEKLKDTYMKMRQTKEEWKKEALQFQSKWQFINCGGCIDGKHIRIVKPRGSGALYYNYKKFYSIVLMAIVNAEYEFIYVDIGKQGRLSDGGVLEDTSFYRGLNNGGLNLPTNEENEEGLNFVFIGDEAFGLHENILKPYSQRNLNYGRRIFNYRISRARNVVENAFGLMAARFRVFHTSINLEPKKVRYIVLAACALHNFLVRTNTAYYNPHVVDTEDSVTHEVVPGTWRTEIDKDLIPLENIRPKNPPMDAKNSRQNYLCFFNSKGKIPWQDDMISKGKA